MVNAACRRVEGNCEEPASVLVLENEKCVGQGRGQGLIYPVSPSEGEDEPPVKSLACLLLQRRSTVGWGSLRNIFS